MQLGSQCSDLMVNYFLKTRGRIYVIYNLILVNVYILFRNGSLVFGVLFYFDVCIVNLCAAANR